MDYINDFNLNVYDLASILKQITESEFEFILIDEKYKTYVIKDISVSDGLMKCYLKMTEESLDK